MKSLANESDSQGCIHCKTFLFLGLLTAAVGEAVGLVVGLAVGELVGYKNELSCRVLAGKIDSSAKV